MNALDQAATGKWVSLELDPAGHTYGGYVVALCEKPKSEVAVPILECRSDELEFETGSCEPDCEGAAAASPDFDEDSSSTSTDGAVTLFFFSVLFVLVMILSGVVLIYLIWYVFTQGTLFIGPGANVRAEAYRQSFDGQSGTQAQTDIGMAMPGPSNFQQPPNQDVVLGRPVQVDEKGVPSEQRSGLLR